MTATVLAFDGTPLVFDVSGDDLAYLTDCSTEDERNLVNDRVERTLWGPTSYVSRVGNRRMVAAGTTLVAEFGTLPSVTVVTHDYGYGPQRFLL